MTGKVKIAAGVFGVGAAIIASSLLGGSGSNRDNVVPDRGPKPVQVNAPGGPLHYLDVGDCLPLEPHATCKRRLTTKER